MWEKILAYLTFTRKERLGILVLLVVVPALFVLPYFTGPKIGTADEEAFQQYAGKIRKFQSTRLSGSTRHRNRESDTAAEPPSDVDDPERDSVKAEQSDLETQKKATLFYFDPNRISPDEGRRLGLSDRQMLTIIHYRQKGGGFDQPEDLRKLYGLRNVDYERLLPFVRIGRSSGRQPTVDRRRVFVRSENRLREFRRAPAENQKHSFRPIFNSSRKQLEDLDVNLADSSAWSRLPGIGMRLACRIVHFREKLGGFYTVDQLSETFGLPDSTFQHIRPFLHIREAGLQKIDLNSAGQESLQMHPYIRWKLAKGIVQYRDQHGSFKSVGELQQLAQMEPDVFKKLSPYLEVR